MRFLQTSDWQLGHRSRQLAGHEEALQRERLAAVRRALELAVEEKVDLVLVAGDLFDSPDPADATVAECVALLDAVAPLPVFVLPGNHDRLEVGGVWERQAWRRVGRHVRLLDQAEEVPLPGGAALYPCPLRQRQSSRDPTAWIPARRPGEERIRVGLAHGSFDLLPSRVNFPIASRRPAEAGLDYLALGDWHGLWVGEGVAYAGTPEATSFGEKMPGHVLLVTVDDATRRVEVEARRVGRLVWVDLEGELADVTDVEQLAGRVPADTPAGDLVVRARLRVAAGAEPEVLAALEDWWHEVAGGAFISQRDLAVAGGGPLDLPAGAFEEIGRALDLAAGGESCGAPFDMLAGREPATIEAARSWLARRAHSGEQTDP